jgi:transcriptional/translational regulatory protein YebC/TACO1
VIGTYNLIFNIFSLVRNNVGSAVVIEGVTSNRNLDNLCVKFCLNGIKAKLSKFLFDVTPSITTAEPTLFLTKNSSQ